MRASFNLCMFSPMFYEEMVLCGDEGRLKAFENEDILPVPRPQTHLEMLCGENGPRASAQPGYPAYIQDSGHNGATFYEHINFVDNIEGERPAPPQWRRLLVDRGRRRRRGVGPDRAAGGSRNCSGERHRRCEPHPSTGLFFVKHVWPIDPLRMLAQSTNLPSYQSTKLPSYQSTEESTCHTVS